MNILENRTQLVTNNNTLREQVLSMVRDLPVQETGGVKGIECGIFTLSSASQTISFDSDLSSLEYAFIMRKGNSTVSGGSTTAYNVYGLFQSDAYRSYQSSGYTYYSYGVIFHGFTTSLNTTNLNAKMIELNSSSNKINVTLTSSYYLQAGIEYEYMFIGDNAIGGAVTPDEPSTITFTIGNASHQADSGMTWAEWISSDKYDGKGNWYIDNGFVYSFDGMILQTGDGAATVKGTDVIIANCSYRV